MIKEEGKYKIIKRKKPTFYFFGVTTGKSSIMKIFPLWMKDLGFPEISIVGVDFKIHDEIDAYRSAVAQIKYDHNSLGALVTTHKMDLYEASKDMFDYFDPYAKLLDEISCISKNCNNLEGHAKDPISSGLSFDHIVEKKYFAKTGGYILFFGAGGSCIATVLHIINKKNAGDRPEKIIVVNRSQPRLDHLKEIVKKAGTDIKFEYIHNQNPKINDKIIEALPDYSIVINATGMGKDSPGSPVTDKSLFPQNGIVWEFNYRGELDFLHHGERQENSRGVRAENGWVYFIHGWTQVISQVLHLEMTPELSARLEKIANLTRQKGV